MVEVVVELNLVHLSLTVLVEPVEVVLVEPPREQLELLI